MFPAHVRVSLDDRGPVTRLSFEKRLDADTRFLPVYGIPDGQRRGKRKSIIGSSEQSGAAMSGKKRAGWAPRERASEHGSSGRTRTRSPSKKEKKREMLSPRMGASSWHLEIRPLAEAWAQSPCSGSRLVALPNCQMRTGHLSNSTETNARLDRYRLPLGPSKKKRPPKRCPFEEPSHQRAKKSEGKKREAKVDAGNGALRGLGNWHPAHLQAASLSTGSSAVSGPRRVPSGSQAQT